MTRYEELLEEAEKAGVKVLEISMNAFDGLYANGVIFINTDLETNAEKTCVLAEELGHHYTVVDNIIDQRDGWNRHEEAIGRRYAYRRLLGFDQLIAAYRRCAADLYEMRIYFQPFRVEQLQVI